MADTTNNGKRPSGSVYQKREKFFACKFVRLLTKTCAAQEIGTTGFTLVTVIAMQEDAAGYLRSVTFWDFQLMPIIGVKSQKSLAAARRSVVDAGWLHYEPGCKGRVSRYWVTIPDHAAGLDDYPSDEGDADSSPMPRKKDDESGNESGTNREQNGNESGTKLRGKGQPFLPTPEPVPRPLKPIGDGRASKKFRLWPNAKREEFSDPKNAEKVFQLALAAKICTADERFHVFRLVASLVATTGPADDNLPGLITSVLRGDAGRDPWRARGSSDAHERQAREWIRSLDCSPDKQRRTSDLMPEADPKAERDRQKAALKASKFAARDGPPLDAPHDFSGNHHAARQRGGLLNPSILEGKA